MPHFARIYNFACWLTQDRSAAESLVQETYTKALKGLSTYQPGTNFRAWIYRILRHTFLTTQAGLRASSNVTAQGEGPLDANGPPMHEKLLHAHVDLERLRESLEELPMSLREALLLCDLEEMTYKEIAQILGIPAGSVISRLSRARSVLRTLLTAPQPTPAPPPPPDDVPDYRDEPIGDDDYPEIESGIDGDEGDLE